MSSEISAIDYHQETKHTPQSVKGGGGLNFDNKPRLYKLYEDLPSISLDDSIPEPSMSALRAIAEQPANDTNTIDRETLAGLCYYAAGITKTIHRRDHEHEFRAAACTGALYHIDLYPVCGDLEDLDAGVYHYDPRSDSLELLRKGDYRKVLADASNDPTIEEAPVTFIATSTWWRNAWKYKARTYRHAFWDSGTILANLLATASTRNLPAKVVVGFADEPIANLLGIDPEWEAPLELVPVGAGDPVPDSPDMTAVEPIDLSTEPLVSDPKEYPLIYQAWQGSTLSNGTTAREWRHSGNRPINGRGQGEGDRIDLTPVGSERASNRPLYNTIQRRGSCREYERDELSFRKFSTVLDRATRGVPIDVRDNNGRALQFVDCYCIVNGVENIESGAYQYYPDVNTLERLHVGKYRQEAKRLALGQRLGGDAAVCVYFMADLDAVTDVLGDRGYRAAQLEAALTAGRMYLATYAHRDLGGTGLTFFDDLVTEFFEPRTRGQTPMFLYTFGRPD
ncbi:MAG: SagB/ThcOx family dehydrogenase [Halobacteriaceae archaeon]